MGSRNHTIYTGRVGARKRMTSTRRVARRVRGRPVHCHGGPLRGHTLMLTSPHTLTFALHGHVGRYDEGSWHASS